MPDKLFDILAMTDFAEPAKKEAPRKTHRRKTQCYELSTKYLYRRAFSETSLLDACEKFEFQEGYAYHFITGGDVDSLSYLKAILRQQPLSYCLFSTWCMAAEDILQFEAWLQAGRIGHLDAYLGEIFPNSYRVEYQLLKDVFARNTGGGRIAVFKNHSKIYAGVGPKFAFAVETSANINTNPRTENGCITIDQGIYEFYREYFDGIKSFE
ncbi:hypothetical protein [Alistipes sp.]|uniref:hypothetical protein n=1 Tax=Alistipes sp. TaxID=1872444 RepID=UPI003AB8B480